MAGVKAASRGFTCAFGGSRRRFSKEPDHQDFVDVTAILLQGLHFPAIFGKACLYIEPVRGRVVAGDAKLKLLDASRGVLDDGFDQALSKADTARGAAHIHPP